MLERGLIYAEKFSIKRSLPLAREHCREIRWFFFATVIKFVPFWRQGPPASALYKNTFADVLAFTCCRPKSAWISLRSSPRRRHLRSRTRLCPFYRVSPFLSPSYASILPVSLSLYPPLSTPEESGSTSQGLYKGAPTRQSSFPVPNDQARLFSPIFLVLRSVENSGHGPIYAERRSLKFSENSPHLYTALRSLKKIIKIFLC